MSTGEPVKSEGIKNTDKPTSNNLTRAFLEASKLLDKFYTFPDDDMPVLYHYTTAEGLKGIVESGTLWATHIEFLNDASEILHSQEVHKQVIKECENSDIMSRYGVSSEKILEYDAYLFDGLHVIGNQQPFVASFCEDDDLLSQWRGYAMEGFAVGFDLSDRSGKQAYALRNAALSKIVVRKVLYEYEEKKQALLSIITAAIKADESVPKGPDEISTKAAVRMLVSLLLETWTHTVKNKKFSEEREWRIVCSPTGRRPPLNAKKDDFFVRLSKAQLIPTIRLKPDMLLPITRITCGPNSNPHLTEKGVRMLLQGHSYTDTVEIRHSQVPFRPRY